MKLLKGLFWVCFIIGAIIVAPVGIALHAMGVDCNKIANERSGM